MTRARDVADTQENNGGGVAPFVAGKNKIINGDFAINQRNFTSVTVGATYTFDRYITTTGGTSGTVTYTPQVFTPGAAPVAGYEGKNFMQMVTASYTVADSWAGFTQNIESVRTFAGQTITFSFWAKANTGTPKLGIRFQQFFGTTGSPSAPVNKYATVTAISTSWARYSVTVTLDSLTGKTISTDNTDRLSISLIASAGSSTFEGGFGSMLQNNTFQIWGWQVEAGSVATPFTTATGTVQGELAACQRYFQIICAGSTTGRNSTTSAAFNPTFPSMRITAITFTVTGALILTDEGVANYTQSPAAVAVSTNNGNNGARLNLDNFSGLTAYRGLTLTNAHQILASAEL
jgi:hypothetical protein